MSLKRFEGQRKPEKERSKNKEIAELKRENQLLKRQLSRLRKQVTQLLDAQGEMELEASPLAKSNEVKTVCESCGGGNVVAVDLPVGRYVVCKDCKTRRRAA